MIEKKDKSIEAGIEFNDEGVSVSESVFNDDRVTSHDKRIIQKAQSVISKDDAEDDPFALLAASTSNSRKIEQKRKLLVREGVDPSEAEMLAEAEVRKSFPPKPQIIDWEAADGNRSMENAFYAYELLIHTPKAYGALEGRRGGTTVNKKRLRPIPTIFRFAAKSGVVVDYALKGKNHIMAYQFLIKMEELLAELEQEIKILDEYTKNKVAQMSNFGTRTKKLVSDRPSQFKLAFKNPYPNSLALLIVMYDHIERTLLPMRANNMLTAKEYALKHRPIQTLINRIKTLPEMFTFKHSFEGGVPKYGEKGVKLPECLDLAGFVEMSLKSQEDPETKEVFDKLFSIVGQPSRELVQGKIKPNLVPSIKPIKHAM